MNCRYLLFGALTSFCVGGGLAQVAAPPAKQTMLGPDSFLRNKPASGIPPLAVQTVKCIRRVLKSSGSVSSVTLYSIDSSRIAIEVSFVRANGRSGTFDVEYFAGENGSITMTDRIPTEIPQEVADEAEILLSSLRLQAKCNFAATFDNVLPEAAARTEWRRLNWPKGYRSRSSR